MANKIIDHDTILYSPSVDACYIKDVSTDIPADAVEVPWDNYIKYWCGVPPEGQSREWNDATHTFYWKMGVLPIELTLEQKQGQLRARMSSELILDIHTNNKVYAGDMENRLDILKAKLNGGGYVRNGQTIVELDAKTAKEVYEAMMEKNRSVKLRFKKLFDDLLEQEKKKTNKHGA